MGFDLGAIVLVEVETGSAVGGGGHEGVETEGAVTALAWMDCADREPKEKDFLKK